MWAVIRVRVKLGHPIYSCICLDLLWLLCSLTIQSGTWIPTSWKVTQNWCITNASDDSINCIIVCTSKTGHHQICRRRSRQGQIQALCPCTNSSRNIPALNCLLILYGMFTFPNCFWFVFRWHLVIFFMLFLQSSDDDSQEGLCWWQVVGMASIRGVSVPMYTTLRRTTVLFTMVMEFFLLGQRHTTPIITRLAKSLLLVFSYASLALDMALDAQWYHCGRSDISF